MRKSSKQIKSVNLLVRDKLEVNTLFSIIILFFFNIAVNSWVVLKAQCLDDFTHWSIFKQKGALEFIFNTVSNKFRPLYNTIILILYKLFGSHIYLFDTTNILISYGIAIMIFFMARKISKHNTIALCSGSVFLASRFAYYQISQVFGIMEALALTFAILVFYYLYQYLNCLEVGKCEKYFLIAGAFYLFVCYTHERYIVLFPLFIIVNLLKEKLCNFSFKRILLVLFPTIIFLSTVIIRYLLLGNRLMDGTNGISVVDSFDILHFLEFLISQILYIFGVNAGPGYLNGMPTTAVPVSIYALNALIIIPLVVVSIQFIKKMKQDRNNRSTHLNNTILFICFIGACIISSSVTIRLEMRWIYVSFTAAVLFFSYMLQAIMSNDTMKKKKYNSGIALCLAFTVPFIPMEIYFRGCWHNIHFWGAQLYYNSIYEETIERYGDDFWNKNITVVSSGHNILTEDVFAAFLSQFKKESNTRMPEIKIVTSMSDITRDEVVKGNITLIEDIHNFRYVDINEMLVDYFSKSFMASSLKEALLPEGGPAWEGGKVKDYIWAAQTFDIKLLTKENGEMVLTSSILEYNLPNTLNVYIDSKLIAKVELTNITVNYTFNVPKNKVVDIKLELDHAVSPYSAGVGEDRRILGLCIGNIEMR